MVDIVTTSNGDFSFLEVPGFKKGGIIKKKETKIKIHDISSIELTLGGWDLDNLVLFETTKQWFNSANKYGTKHKIDYNIEPEDYSKIKYILLEMNGRETILTIKEDGKITNEIVYVLSSNISKKLNIVILNLTIPTTSFTNRKYIYAPGHKHLCQECHKRLYFSEVVDSNKSIISVDKLKELWKVKQVGFYCCTCYKKIINPKKPIGVLEEVRQYWSHDIVISSTNHQLGLCEPDPNHPYFVSVGESEQDSEDDSYELNESIPISISFNNELDNINYVSIDPPEHIENTHIVVESEDYQEIVRRISTELFIGFETRESRRERRIRESRREIREISLDDLEAELMDDGET